MTSNGRSAQALPLLVRVVPAARLVEPARLARARAARPGASSRSISRIARAIMEMACCCRCMP